MSIETYVTLGSNVIDIENLDKLEITQRVNEHGNLYLSAIVKEDKKDDYIRLKSELTNIEVGYIVEGEDNPVTLFKGLVTKPYSTKLNGKMYIEIEAKTDSYLIDIKKNFRSFQDKGVKYSEICKEVLNNYMGGNYGYSNENDCITDRFILQYDETDWEFLKRLGSYNNFAILPEMTLGGPKIFVGFPKGNNIGQLEKYNYTISARPIEYKKLKENTYNTREISELDLIEIEIEMTDNYEIGDKVLYNNDESGDQFDMYIREKITFMNKGVLTYRYTFGQKNSFYQDRIFNKDIVGLALKGKVLDRVQDTVKVHLIDIDDEERTSTHYFKYATPYTAGNSTGWYVMPEIGDIVFIKCTDRDENNAIAENGIRTDGLGKIGDPNIKYLRTKDGRELKLSPDELVITCSNWTNEKTGAYEKIYIQMKAGEGITIRSSKDVNVHAEGDLTLTSDKKVSIKAEEEIDIKCKSSGIKLDSSSITIESPDVKIN